MGCSGPGDLGEGGPEGAACSPTRCVLHWLYDPAVSGPQLLICEMGCEVCGMGDGKGFVAIEGLDSCASLTGREESVASFCGEREAEWRAGWEGAGVEELGTPIPH